MADYLVTGKKGNGKSLVCVGRIRDALRAGKLVATNLDIYLYPMLGPWHSSARLIRLPDKPTRADLDIIGYGSEQARMADMDLAGDGVPLLDETTNGLLVLDELGTWMNSRTYADKDREGVLNWFVHSRKLGWDTYLIAQGPAQIDKQIRETQVEYHVPCRRMDKIKIGGVKLPRIHLGFVKYGLDRESIVSERWLYRGNDLFRCYNTYQKFRPVVDFGPYSLLPPWQARGRYLKLGFWDRMRWKFLGELPKKGQGADTPPRKPRHPLAGLLARLPADQRIRHFHRFQALGAFA